MCMEDIRLGRQVMENHNAQLVSAGATVQLLAENKNRVSLILFCEALGGGSVRISIGSSAVADTILAADATAVGFGNTQHMELNIKDHGMIVTRAIFATVTAVASFAAAWESILNKE